MTSTSRIRVLVLLFLASAGTCVAQVPFPATHAVSQIIDPVQLDKDTTRLYLAAYVSGPPDSITFSKGIKSDWNKKGKTILIKSLPELKPLSEMKLWIAGSAYSVILKKAINIDKDDPGRPVINTSKLGRGSFTIAANYSRSPFSMACYWQNFKLGKGYIKRTGEEMLVIIPEEAKKIKRTYIRVFANDDESRSNDILIPLEYGEVVNDPKQLNQYASFHFADSVIAGPHIDAGKDPVIDFVSDKTLDSVGAKLKSAIAFYGSNHVVSGIDLHHRDKRFDLANTNVAAFIAAIPGFGVDSIYVSTFTDRKDKEIANKLLKLRADYLALQYGETDIASKGNIMMIKRTFFSQTVLFVFNKTKEKQSVETGMDLTAARTVFGHTTSGGKVDLPPMSFEVFIK